MKHHWVYYLKNADDAVVYIGSTTNFDQRIKVHRSEAPWFGEIKSVNLVPYGHRVDAMDAEAAEIAKYKPFYNLKDAVGRGDAAGNTERILRFVCDAGRSVTTAEVREATGIRGAAQYLYHLGKRGDIVLVDKIDPVGVRMYVWTSRTLAASDVAA